MTNNTSTIFHIQNADLGFYGLAILLPIATLAIILNAGVLLCLVKRKSRFQNHGYWFQLIVLSSVDLCNGFVSVCLSFITTELFTTNSTACSFLIGLFVCSQINTLCTTCCICISRFRGIRNINTAEERQTLFQQKVTVILASAFSCLYCVGPFMIWRVRDERIEQCQAAFLFGLNERYFKMYICVGIFTPWLITNILYGICVIKLKRASATIRPLHHVKATSSTCLSPTVQTRNKPKSLQVSEAKGGQRRLQPPQKANGQGRITTIADNQKSTTQETHNHIFFPADSKAASITPVEQNIASGFKTRRDAQIRATKLLGIILILNNLTTTIPLSTMLRDVILSKPGVASFNGLTALGFVFLSMNSLVDAFVYGFYTKEIRTFLFVKFQNLRSLFRSRLT